MLHPAKAFDDFDTSAARVNEMNDNDVWLEAGRLIVARHAMANGYPAPEVHEDTTTSGKRRLWWIDGEGNKLQYAPD